jgi:hypothetical protein
VYNFVQHAAAPLRKHRVGNAKEIIELCDCSWLNHPKVYSFLFLFNPPEPKCAKLYSYCNVKT